MVEASLGAAYFERLYAQSDDPWNFATSEYEKRKYAETLRLLGSQRFSAALEIGCSIGVLTSLLAGRCDALFSIDVSERALALASARNAARSNVRFERIVFPEEAPAGPFDLVMLSEVGYYWSDRDLALARDRIVESAPGGTVELVHYLPKVDDYVRDGDAVHEAFLADERYERLRSKRADSYRIDVLRVRA